MISQHINTILLIIQQKIQIKNLKIQVFYGVPGGIRTPDLKVRSLAFYPAKLQAHIILDCSPLIYKQTRFFNIIL